MLPILIKPVVNLNLDELFNDKCIGRIRKGPYDFNCDQFAGFYQDGNPNFINLSKQVSLLRYRLDLVKFQDQADYRYVKINRQFKNDNKERLKQILTLIGKKVIENN